jgi:hypothetical protein
MKLSHRLLTVLFVSMPLFLLTGNAKAQDPAATFSFTTTSVQVAVGFTWGQGTLLVGDKVYSFDVTGFNLVGVGVTTAVINGTVPTLTNPEDFAGTYKGGAAGLTIGGGGTSVKMTNDKGVTIELTTASEGVQMNIGGGGLKIKNLSWIQPE